MKIIISDNQIEKLKKVIDKLGIDKLGIEPYKLIEMGLVKSLPDNLHLRDTPIKSLGKLKSVGGDLVLENTQIKSFGRLKSVEGNLYLKNPLSNLSNEEIRSQVEINGKIFRD